MNYNPYFSDLITRTRLLQRTLLASFAAVSLLAGLPAAASETTGPPRWEPPVARPYTLDRAFDKPAKNWMAGHRGVDFAVDAGADIYAPAAGEITFSGTVVDRQVITITHEDGRKSSFEPVISALPVGNRVIAGQRIAAVSSDIKHCTGGGYCLHWGVRESTQKAEDYINPLLLLEQLEPSILLPIGEDFSA